MKNLAYVFAGQGSQRPGMGQDFYENFNVAKEAFDRANAVLDFDLLEVCFTENEKIDITSYTQPAILATEVAILEVLKKEYHLEAQYFAGHSLGEYTALVAANVLSLEAATQVVHKRGQLMQSAVGDQKTLMAALVLENLVDTNYQEIINQAGAEVANFNSKDQTVISGTEASVEEACKKLEEKFADIRAIRLNVSAPFHSSLMKPIETEFAAYLQKFLNQADVTNLKNCEKVLSNYTGTFHKLEDLAENLVKQISGSVRFIENMQALNEKAATIYEIGPNKPLSKFFSAHGISIISIINTRSLKRNLEKPVLT